MRVIVAGQLPRQAHNAPLHLFSASPDLVGFGGGAYRQRSEQTSLLLRQLFERLQGEGLTVSYTMQDFKRDFFKEKFAKLPPEERRPLLESLLAEELQAGLSPEQIRQWLDQLTAGRPAQSRKPRRKK